MSTLTPALLLENTPRLITCQPRLGLAQAATAGPSGGALMVTIVAMVLLAVAVRLLRAVTSLLAPLLSIGRLLVSVWLAVSVLAVALVLLVLSAISPH